VQRAERLCPAAVHSVVVMKLEVRSAFVICPETDAGVRADTQPFCLWSGSKDVSRKHDKETGAVGTPAMNLKHHVTFHLGLLRLSRFWSSCYANPNRSGIDQQIHIGNPLLFTNPGLPLHAQTRPAARLCHSERAVCCRHN
jgi:hypothetical protein